MGSEGPIGPVVGNPVKKSYFARTLALARKMRFRWETTIRIWMEIVVEMDLRNLILRAYARKMRFRFEKKRCRMDLRFRWKKTIWIRMGMIVEWENTRNI